MEVVTLLVPQAAAGQMMTALSSLSLVDVSRL